MPDFVHTQDISSGRVHKRYRTEAGYATHEADNLDEAGAYRVLTDAEWVAFQQNPQRHKLGCQRCYQPYELGMATPDGFPEPGAVLEATAAPEDDASTHSDDTP